MERVRGNKKKPLSMDRLPRGNYEISSRLQHSPPRHQTLEHPCSWQQYFAHRLWDLLYIRREHNTNLHIHPRNREAPTSGDQRWHPIWPTWRYLFARMRFLWNSWGSVQTSSYRPIPSSHRHLRFLCICCQVSQPPLLQWWRAYSTYETSPRRMSIQQPSISALTYRGSDARPRPRQTLWCRVACFTDS